MKMTTIGLAVFAFTMMSILTSKDVMPGLYKPRPRPRLWPWLKQRWSRLKRRAGAVGQVLAGLKFIRQEYDLEMGARWCNREPIEHFLVFAVCTVSRQLITAATKHTL